MKTYLNDKAYKARAGFSLVEIMVALLVLTVLTIGGASMMMRSGETIAHQRNKRIAIDAANRRMEQVRSTPYTLFNPIGVEMVFLEPSGTSFSWSNSDPGETVVINGLTLPIKTRMRRVSHSSTSNSYADGDSLEIEVQVIYKPGSGDDIVLTSYFR